MRGACPDPALSRLDEARAIAKLAAPIAMAQFGLTALGLVDLAVLGHANAEQFGGASIGRSINFVGIALGIGASIALEPLASQAVGAGEPRAAWRSYLASVLLAVAMWVPCSALALASTWLLDPLGIGPELVAPARAFLVGQLPGQLFFVLFLSSKTFLQAHGRTSASLWASGVANLVNVVVCNVLVLGDDCLQFAGLAPVGAPRLGALGAGLASSVASFVLFGWVAVAAYRIRPPFEVGTPARLPRALPVRKLLGLALPVGLQLLAEIGVFSLVAVIAGRLGHVAVSAHQIAIGLAGFTFMGALGVSGATAVRVGYAIGERRSPRSVGLMGIVIGGAFMSLCGLVFFLVPRSLVRVFTGDVEVIDLGARLLVVAAAFQLFDGVQVVAAGALRGAGDVRFAFVANVAAHWFIGFPLAMALGFGAHLGAQGMWMGLLVGLAAVAAALLVRFYVVTRQTIERV